MDRRLQGMWEDINQRNFSGELESPGDIDWGEISGDNGISAHGVFFDKARAIAIDERFKFDEEATKAGDQEETRKAECAYRLLMHEMIHQVLHQRKAPQPGGHGSSFWQKRSAYLNADFLFADLESDV